MAVVDVTKLFTASAPERRFDERVGFFSVRQTHFGFSNAIVAADAPANDPDWSPEDIRHTMNRWLPSTTENAVAPHVSDPRTGEILNGSARIFQNVLNMQRDWYFTQASQLDPRARVPDAGLAHGAAPRVRRGA
jgi:hypothetical protein